MYNIHLSTVKYQFEVYQLDMTHLRADIPTPLVSRYSNTSRRALKAEACVV